MATIAEALEVAFQHHMAGRAQEAEVIYRRILDADPENVDALYLLGMLYAQASCYAEAAPCLAKAIALRPGQPDHYLHLGNALRLAGRAGEAVKPLRVAATLRPDDSATWEALGTAADGALAHAALSHAVALTPQHPRLWDALARRFADARRFDAVAALALRLHRQTGDLGLFWKTPYYVVLNVGNSLLATGDHAGLEALFRSLSVVQGGFDDLVTAWLGFLYGSFRLIRGDEAGAQAAFDAIAPALPLVRHFSPGARFDELARRDPAAWAAYEATLTIDGPIERTGEPVLYTAADGAYTDRFATLFLRSADVHARPGQRAHLHVVDPGPETLARLDTLKGQLRNLRLAVSWERSGDGLSDIDRMTYYTCVRFLRLPALIERYGAPMVISDIDAVWLGDPAAFAAALSPEQPLALVYDPSTLSYLYDGVGGGVAVLRPEAPVRAFADEVAGFLFHWVQRKSMAYFLDQTALVAAAGRYERRPGNAAIQRIAVSSSVYRLGEGVCYQILGGKRDPAFGERVAALLAAGPTPEGLAAFVADDAARG